MTEENKEVKQVPKKDVRKIDEKKFVVTESFTDLEDNNKKYKKGDVFKTVGKAATRIELLSSKQNKRKKAVIKEQE